MTAPPPSHRGQRGVIIYRRWLGLAASGLMIGLALCVVGEAGIGPWLVGISFVTGTWAAHRFGRQGYDVST